MAEIASAFVTLAPSARGFGSKLTSQVGGEVDNAGRSMGARFGKLFAAAGGALAAVGIGKFLADSVGAASDLAESQSKVGVVFGKSAKRIMTASKTSAKAMGLSQGAYLEAAGTLGNLLVSLDIAPDKAAGLSKQMVKLAGDMASFNNTSPEDALDALRSGLTGETEPLKRYGVNMNDATLHAQALKMGLIETIKDGLTPQAKALSAQALIMEQTKTAQGDFARTSGGLANQQRILAAEFDNVKAKVGGALLPLVTKFVTFLTSKALPKLSDWWRKLAPARQAVANFARGVGEIIGLIKDGKWDEAWQAVKDAAVRALKATLDAAKNFLTQHLLPAIVSALGSIREAWRKRWTDFWKDPDGAYNKTERRTDTFGVRMSDKMSRIGISVIGSLMKGLSKLPAIAYRNGVSIVSGLGLGMQGMPRLMIAIGTNSITGLMKGLAAAPGLARTMGVRIVGALKDGVGNLSHLLYGAGAELIQGLIDGIESKLGALASTMGGVASKIKGFLPGSPVKEGPLTSWNRGGAGKRLIDQGLIAGIEARRRSVGASMDRLASGISLPSADLAVAGVGQVGGSAAHSGGGRRAIHIHLGDREFVRYIDERIDTHFDLTREHARASR